MKITNAGTKFLKEFKDFALRGNIFDMAIGVVIGTAFSKIVSSLVSDLIMPLMGMLVGSVNFNDLTLALPGSDAELKYGAFLQTIFDFTIIAFAIFMVMKFINELKRKLVQEAKAEEAAAAPAEPPADVKLLTEIRDLLKSANPAAAAAAAKAAEEKKPEEPAPAAPAAPAAK